MFAFDYRLSGSAPGAGRVTVVYLTDGQVTPGDLEHHLRRHLAESLPPDRLLIVSPSSIRKAMEAIGSSPEIKARFAGILSADAGTPIDVVVHDGNGDLEVVTGTALTVSDYASMIRAGLITIFRKRSGILVATSGHHYVKPSGRHTTSFIRTGNVLIRDAEVGFVAFALLHLVPSDVNHIYTDTASINWVAQRVAQLRSQLTDDSQTITVDSFSSYAGLSSLDVPSPDKSVLLISASTSGGLQRELGAKLRLSSNRVLTMFYLGDAKGAGTVLCDLTRRPSQDGYEPITSYEPGSCTLCAQGSSPLLIAGDQFLPGSATTRSVTISATDAPSWLEKFAFQMVGTHAVRVHHSRSATFGRPRLLFIAVDKAIESDSRTTSARDRASQRFTDELAWWTRTSLPASTDCIVFMDDAGSAAIAVHLGEFIKANTNREARLVSRREISEDPRILAGFTSVVVVAGAVATGRQLVGVSRQLRDQIPSAAVTYLVGLTRTASPATWSDLRSNLGYGPNGPRQYPVTALSVIELPDETERSAWSAESDFLIELRTKVGKESEMDLIDLRSTVLDKALGDEEMGLLDELFLRPIDRPEPMALGENFAFWRFDYSERLPTQADVFATVAAILHSMRNTYRGGQSLRQTEHERTVLHPSNFARFTDGVIQASLLRAATGSELDYSGEQRMSALMLDVLESTYLRRLEAPGEALPEFLLALALGRLRLTPEDDLAFAKLLSSASLPGIAGLIARFLEKRCGLPEPSTSVQPLSQSQVVGRKAAAAPDPPAEGVGVAEQSSDAAGKDSRTA